MDLNITLHDSYIESPFDLHVSVRGPDWISNNLIYLLLEAYCKTKNINTRVNELNCYFQGSHNDIKSFLIRLDNKHPNPIYPKPEFDSPAKQEVLNICPSAFSLIHENNKQGRTSIYAYYDGPTQLTEQNSEAEAWQYVIDHKLVQKLHEALRNSSED